MALAIYKPPEIVEKLLSKTRTSKYQRGIIQMESQKEWLCCLVTQWKGHTTHLTFFTWQITTTPTTTAVCHQFFLNSADLWFTFVNSVMVISYLDVPPDRSYCNVSFANFVTATLRSHTALPKNVRGYKSGLQSIRQSQCSIRFFKQKNPG